jgi:dipeptidase
LQSGETNQDNLGPDYIQSSTYPDRSIYNWNASKPMIYIDQVSHTYAYTMGSYGIQNEKQLSIGESTCAAVYTSSPVSAGGQAAMDMQTLTQLAMERCETARCAVKLMGEMAVSYGFYGPLPEQELSGEALVVADTTEAWSVRIQNFEVPILLLYSCRMFHVLPDDTQTSAIWVAQRVPNDHITAVANQFVIGEIDLSDKANYLGSSNLLTIAAANGLWEPSTPFHFAKVYGLDIAGQSMMCTRRIWRIFTLAAPSLLDKLSPFTDSWGTFGYGLDGTEPYPFSVKPDSLLKVKDFIEMNRDQYEGTLFDMTVGVGKLCRNKCILCCNESLDSHPEYRCWSVWRSYAISPPSCYRGSLEWCYYQRSLEGPHV